MARGSLDESSSRNAQVSGSGCDPLIDVVFLLLIFFMVSTTFERESQILIELPEATGEEAEHEKDELDITINIAGTFFVNKREVINTEIETLKRAIGKAVGGGGISR